MPPIPPRLAQRPEIRAVCAFFEQNLSRDNDAVYNPEFFDPDGVRAAILRGQLKLACDEKGGILAAARFYRKRGGEVSLYQFAVAPAARGRGLARELFDAIRAGSPMAALCPKDSAFNPYYRRTGWVEQGEDGLFTRWRLE